MPVGVPRNNLVLFQALHYLQLKTDSFGRIPLTFYLLKRIWLLFVFLEMTGYTKLYTALRDLFSLYSMASLQLLYHDTSRIFFQL